MIAAPTLFRIELTTACIVQWRIRGLEKLQTNQNITSISAFLDPKNMILYSDDDDFEEAVSLAISHEHRIADCLFVALARRLDLALLTADMKQAQIARQESIEVTFIETR
jgi:predicted nucleic acid-binding protein